MDRLFPVTTSLYLEPLDNLSDQCIYRNSLFAVCICVVYVVIPQRTNRFWEVVDKHGSPDQVAGGFYPGFHPPLPPTSTMMYPGNHCIIVI